MCVLRQINCGTCNHRDESCKLNSGLKNLDKKLYKSDFKDQRKTVVFRGKEMSSRMIEKNQK